MSGFDVVMSSLPGSPTAIGSAGPFTLVADRPADAGGGGLGFNGGQLLNLAVAACISNDLFREGAKRGISIRHVRVKVTSEYAGEPAVSSPIEYEVEIDGDADSDVLDRLVRETDAIAEIPNSLRQGTGVLLSGVSVAG
ncbi:MAG: OsmC family protein [Actinomycetota bacterium]|nr:OsmC family protein [Actinomycetota bacterium]